MISSCIFLALVHIMNNLSWSFQAGSNAIFSMSAQLCHLPHLQMAFSVLTSVTEIQTVLTKYEWLGPDYCRYWIHRLFLGPLTWPCISGLKQGKWLLFLFIAKRPTLSAVHCLKSHVVSDLTSQSSKKQRSKVTDLDSLPTDK